MSELAASATAVARLLHHHVLKYRMSLGAPLATAVVVAVAANLELMIDIVWYQAII